MEEEVKPSDYIRVLKYRRRLILLVFISAVIASLIISFLQTKIYVSTVSILPPEAAQERGSLTTSRLPYELRQQFPGALYGRVPASEVIIALLKSRRMREDIVKRFNLTSIDKIAKATKIKVSKEGVISVTVGLEDPNLVCPIANFYAENLNNLNRELNISSAKPIAIVLDSAKVPEKPSKPRKKLNLAIGLVVGLMLGLGSVFVIEAFDKSLKSVEDVEKIAGLPILGLVPAIKEKEGRSDAASLITNLSPESRVVEFYRNIRTGIQFASPDNPIKTILVTSPGTQEGKSITAANLAITMAQSDAKTILVGSDLRKPELCHLFDKPKEPGLTDVLAGSAKLSETIRSTNLDNLWLVPSGRIPPDPSRILGAQRMKDLLNKLKADYDFILLDAPPVIVVTDALILGVEADGVILVIRSSKTDREAVLRAKTLLNNVGSKIIGAVLNDVDIDRIYGRYYSHYYPK